MAGTLSYEELIRESGRLIQEYLLSEDTGSVLIIGNNATGKTHLLHKLCQAFLENMEYEVHPYLIGTRNRSFSLNDFQKAISRQDETDHEELAENLGMRVREDAMHRLLLYSKKISTESWKKRASQATVEITASRCSERSQYLGDDLLRTGDGRETGRTELVDYLRPCVDAAIRHFNNYLDVDLSVVWDGANKSDSEFLIAIDNDMVSEGKAQKEYIPLEVISKGRGEEDAQAYYGGIPMTISTGHQAILRILTELEFLMNSKLGAGFAPDSVIVFLDEPDQQLSVKQNSTFLSFLQNTWPGLRIVAAVHSVDFIRHASNCRILGIPGADENQCFSRPLWHKAEEFTSYASIYSELKVLRRENISENRGNRDILSEREHVLREYYLLAMEQKLTEDDKADIQKYVHEKDLSRTERLLLRYIEEYTNEKTD